MRRPKSLYPWYRSRLWRDIELMAYGVAVGALVALGIWGDILVWHIL